MAEVLVSPMTAGYAADILSWRYPAPYDFYDVPGGDPGYYTDPANGFFAVLSPTPYRSPPGGSEVSGSSGSSAAALLCRIAACSSSVKPRSVTARTASRGSSTG
jgi:hypothetical protein